MTKEQIPIVDNTKNIFFLSFLQKIVITLILRIH